MVTSAIGILIFDKHSHVKVYSETQLNLFITNIWIERYITYRSPHLIIQARFDVTMKTRILPILRSRCQTVFDGIIVNVFHVVLEILIVSNHVFPKSTLPKCSLLFTVS